MCTSPLLIKNPTSYPNKYFTSYCVEVPCGKCSECRNSRQSEWQTRLSADISSLYKRGGCAIFVTLTFNNYNLPFIDFFDNGDLFHVPVFSPEKLKSFLATTKTLFHRKFGKSSYRYFGCMEYGKNTKRQHLHILYMLEPVCSDSESVSFIMATIRKIWKYGFTFPASNDKSCVEIRSKGPAVKYVSKYITKDLAYYSLPSVVAFQNYIRSLSDKDIQRYYKSCLAHPFMSKGIGRSIINNDTVSSFARNWSCPLDDKTCCDLLVNGFYDDFTQKYFPLPQYCRNKILYWFDRSNRFSSITGKLLYERRITPFFRRNMRFLFNLSLKSYSDSVSKFFTDSKEFVDCYIDRAVSSVGLVPSVVKESISYIKSHCDDFINKLALYHIYGKYISPSLYKYSLFKCHVNNPVIDSDTLFVFFRNKIDSLKMSKLPSFRVFKDFSFKWCRSFFYDCSLYSKLELCFKNVDEFFSRYFILHRAVMHAEYDIKQDKTDYLRRLYLSFYPVDLC